MFVFFKNQIELISEHVQRLGDGGRHPRARGRGQHLERRRHEVEQQLVKHI